VTIEPSPSPPVDGDDDAVGFTLIPGSRVVVDDEAVRLAIRLVENMDVIDRLSQWKVAERKGRGGRPETFSMHALLVAMALCVITDQPPQVRRFCDVLFRQLSPTWRTVLDVPDPPAADDARGWRARYRNVRTRFHAMVDLMDPSPTPKNRRLGDTEFRAASELRRTRRSDKDRARRYENLEWFINQLLEASVRLLSEEDRSAWSGSVGVDATLVKSFSRHEKRSKKEAPKGSASDIEIHSVDPDAGWYRRDPDRRDDEDDRPTGKGKSEWGYEASLVVSGPDTPDRASEFPNLVVGMAVLHKPGHEPGRNGVRALASVRGRGHPAGFLAGDRAYSGAVPEKFQLPVLALGYKPVYDYKKTELGVKGQSQGFLEIEGALYCPMIPAALINATVDYRKGRISESLYGQRLEERWRYRARPKSQPDVEGHTRFQCPAASPWFLARCDLKPASVADTTRGKLWVIPSSELKASPPPSCTQQSVIIPPEAGAKFRQALLFQSAEWRATYNLLRNTNEGMNGYVKDPAHEALDEPGRRRIHGVAAQSVLTAMLLMAANVRKIRTFLVTKMLGRTATASRHPRRRRRTKSIETWRPASPSPAPASEHGPPLIA